MNKIEEILDMLEEKYQYKDIIKNNNRIWEKKKKLAIIICLLVDIVIFSVVSYIKKLEPIEGFNEAMYIFYMIGIIFAIVISNLIVIAIIYSKRNTSFKQEKTKFITEFLEKMFTNVKYMPGEWMGKETYLESGYKEEVDLYFSNDLIKIENPTLLEIAEVKTKCRDSDGNKITTFWGLFGKGQLDKSINCELRIMQEASYCHDDNTKIELTSSLFEEKFNIYSTNKIVAMQILTPEVIETILELYNEAVYSLDITIINKNIYLRSHFSDVFEFDEYDRDRMIKLGKTLLNMKNIKSYFNNVVNEI